MQTVLSVDVKLFILTSVATFVSLLMQSSIQSSNSSNVLRPDGDQPDGPVNLSTYLEPECIIGSTDRKGELMFLVKW